MNIIICSVYLRATFISLNNASRSNVYSRAAFNGVNMVQYLEGEEDKREKNCRQK